MFKYLPGYAAFLLKHKLNDYVREVHKYLHEENVPILRFLKDYPEEEMLNIIATLSTKLLSAFATNKVKEYIEK